ncbi:hypothetical protein K8Q98_01595 [Candidatus Nomurabacteria bacterium]|nr:hypothetical protein [Candidatus Nomurabacteria bacterium]
MDGLQLWKGIHVIGIVSIVSVLVLAPVLKDKKPTPTTMEEIVEAKPSPKYLGEMKPLDTPITYNVWVSDDNLPRFILRVKTNNQDLVDEVSALYNEANKRWTNFVACTTPPHIFESNKPLVPKCREIKPTPKHLMHFSLALALNRFPPLAQ